MLVDSLAVVLSKIKYSESSVIVGMYTKKDGLQKYFVPGVRKNKAKFRQNLFQPLSIVDIVYYKKKGKELHSIRDIKFNYQFQSITFDIRKSTLSIFLSEVLSKTIKEHEPNEPLYEFLHNSVILLDQLDSDIGVFHNWFLIKLTSFLGFSALNNYQETYVFDLEEGLFCDKMNVAGPYMNTEISKLFSEVSGCDFYDFAAKSISNRLRKDLLHRVLEFYRIHMPSFGQIRSLEVLEQVFS